MKRIRRLLFAVLALGAFAGGWFLAAHPAYADDGVPDEDGQELIGEVSNAAGFTPCAVFDVNGWGDKWINLNDYPACDFYQPYLTVQCFTNDGMWAVNTVHDVVYHPMYEFETGPVLTFNSTQHGICGIFPTGEGYSSAPAVGYAEALFALLEAFGEEVIHGPANLTSGDLPAYVILVDDAAAPPGDALYIIVTTTPQTIPWEALDAGYYIVEQPANLEWGELPEHLFGGQTEFDEYPEGIFYVTEDPDETTFEPLP